MEWLDIVTEDGTPTGEVVDRETAHREGIRHRTAHVWLVRRRKGQFQILLQKRSANKDSHPGCYDISSAGHIPAGVDYIPSALRELEEELGLSARPEELRLCGQRRFSFRSAFHGKPFFDRQVSNVYLLWRDVGPEKLRLQPSEVESVQWMDFDACREGVAKNRFPHCIMEEELNLIAAALPQEAPSPISCLVLDLDETTLDGEGRLSPENRAALKTVLAQGIEVVLASGRALGTFPAEMLSFPGIRYAIASNGASITHLPSRRNVFRRLLPPEAAEIILSVTADLPVTYDAIVAGQAYAPEDYVRHPERYAANARSSAYVRSTRHPVENMIPFIREHAAELDALNLVVPDPEVKKAAWRRLEETGLPIYITSSTPRLIEICNEQCGKGPAMCALLEHLGIDAAETAAFGNADNDAGMLHAAGYAIAVANASERCKAAADFITKDHRENGVAYALREYLHLI